MLSKFISLSCISLFFVFTSWLSLDLPMFSVRWWTFSKFSASAFAFRLLLRARPCVPYIIGIVLDICFVNVLAIFHIELSLMLRLFNFVSHELFMRVFIYCLISRVSWLRVILCYSNCLVWYSLRARFRALISFLISSVSVGVVCWKLFEGLDTSIALFIVSVSLFTVSSMWVGVCSFESIMILLLR